ncbi:hypothetical protein PG993_002074 [Apiospora rasikravindrae]|uniref:BZIP domain-containing protein n=1 Tax=Apiospora rasikravindrae TaxID=990691 RepID=A0ABR1UD77_9PEZI
MSIPTFEVEDPELENQQRLERRRELNRKAQRRFRTRRNQARIRQIEQDNHLATGWSNDWPWSNSPPSTVPLVAQNQTAGQISFEADEPLALDISALDSMLYPTIPQGLPLREPPALAPFQSPATTIPADSQPLASHAADFGQDGEHYQSATQQIYPSWGAADLSGMTLAESQESTVTNTGSPYMQEASVWSSMMDMSPSQSPEMPLPASCFFPSAMAFDPTTIPVATTETASPIGSQEALSWADMEHMQAAFLWSPVLGTYVQ